MSVVCCQVEVSATGRSIVQRGPTECGVSVINSTLGAVAPHGGGDDFTFLY